MGRAARGRDRLGRHRPRTVRDDLHQTDFDGGRAAGDREPLHGRRVARRRAAARAHRRPDARLLSWHHDPGGDHRHRGGAGGWRRRRPGPECSRRHRQPVRVHRQDGAEQRRRRARTGADADRDRAAESNRGGGAGRSARDDIRGHRVRSGGDDAGRGAASTARDVLRSGQRCRDGRHPLADGARARCRLPVDRRNGPEVWRGSAAKPRRLRADCRCRRSPFMSRSCSCRC